MSQIPSEQGAVKASEVSGDSAQPLLATLTREDLDTILTQTRKVLTDALKRSAGGLLLTSRNAVASSPGTMAWTGTQISFGVNTDILTRLLQNESGAMVQLRANYGATNTASTFNTLPLASGEVLYIELDRSLIPGSGDLVLENAVSGGSLVSGKTIKKATSGPLLADAMSGPSGTLSIPLAINVDGHLWWIPHGIYWPPNTSSPLGAVVTSTSLPMGAILPWTLFGGATPLGYSSTKAQASGFQLCDGSVIIDPQSPHFNPTRNADGTPSLSYNSALDKFTPNLNGPMVTHVPANTYNEGDYVNSGGTNYVAIQAVPALTLITNTAYWQPEATYNNTSPLNPYNKYRKTTQNAGNNTYPRGNAQSFAAESASSYGGANNYTLTIPQLPSHTHTGTTGTESADHTHSGTTGNNNQSLDHTHGYQRGHHGGNYERDGNQVLEFHEGATTGGASFGAGLHTHNFTTGGRSAAHTHSFTTAATGTGASISNEPRYHNNPFIVRIY